MINVYEKNSNQLLGTLTDAQLRFLQDNLEEEWSEDQDYAITSVLVDYFESQGADANLVKMLRDALAGKDEIEVIWSMR